MKHKIICSLLLIALLLAGCSSEAKWQKQYDAGVQALNNTNYSEALENFQSAIKIDPSNINAYIGLADAYIGNGDVESALSALNNVLDAGKTDERFMEKMAEVQALKGIEAYDAGNFSEAAVQLQNAVDNGYSEENAYISLAKSYVGIGEMGKSVDVLSTALEGKSSFELQNALDEMRLLKSTVDRIAGYITSDDFEQFYRVIDKDLDYLNSCELLNGRYGFSFWGMGYDGEKFSANYSGQGLLIRDFDVIYYGDLVDGQPDGNGKSFDKYIGVYEGAWKNALPNGQGTLVVKKDAYILVRGSFVEKIIEESIWTGNWIDRKADGEFTVTNCGDTPDREDSTFGMLLEDGQIVLDDRWTVEGDNVMIHSTGGPNMEWGFNDERTDRLLKHNVYAVSEPTF